MLMEKGVHIPFILSEKNNVHIENVNILHEKKTIILQQFPFSENSFCKLVCEECRLKINKV